MKINPVSFNKAQSLASVGRSRAFVSQTADAGMRSGEAEGARREGGLASHPRHRSGNKDP